MTEYAKAIIAILTATVAALAAAVTDGVVSPSEAVSIAIAILTSVGVWWVPNLDAGVARFAKPALAFTGAGLTALATILASALGWSDVTLSDWLTVALAALGAIGVGIIPNIPVATVEVHYLEAEPAEPTPGPAGV